MRRCLLDMDGVLTDFVAGACSALGVPDPYRPLRPEAAGVFETYKILGISEGDFWAACDQTGVSFWDRLSWMDDGGLILSLVEQWFKPEHVCLFSSPSSSQFELPGKLSWIRRELPPYRRRYLFGPAKHFAAHPDTVLVDDRDANVYTFREAGGRAVLVPRPWNSRWQEADHAAFHVSEDLVELSYQDGWRFRQE